jgi:iron complex transport system substrate-binding protein
MALGAACAKPATAATIIDDLGRPVYIEKTPQRIISLAPSITEILFALDLGDKIVGVTDCCDYPKEAKTKPVVSSYFLGTNLEKLVAQEPDLILTDGYEEGLLQQLDKLKLTTIVLRPENIYGIFRNIELAGKSTGREEEAKGLVAGMEKRLNTIAEMTAKVMEKPIVFYEIDATDPTKPWTATPGSFTNALITLAGGENMVKEKVSQGYFQLSLEEILDADPDMIILGDYPYVSPEDVRQRPGAWQQLTAIKEGKIYAISDPSLTSRPGPRIIDGLEEMAKIIHPELFE